MTYRTAVLISGSGTNLQALIDAQSDPDFPARIELVLSNKADVKGLERAKTAGLKTLVINHREFHNREAFDEAVDAALTDHNIHFVCLAGFMRIFGEDFADKWSGRMLNIHPSLLPAFQGNRAHEQVLASSVTLTGCSVHSVTRDLDGGPIVGQAVVPRQSDDDLDAISSRVRIAEHLLYPLAVRAFLRGQEEALPTVKAPDGMLLNLNPDTKYRPAG